MCMYACNVQSSDSLYVLSLHVSRSTLEVRQYTVYMCAMFIHMYSQLLPRKKNHFAMGHVVMMVLFCESMEFASRLYPVKTTQQVHRLSESRHRRRCFSSSGQPLPLLSWVQCPCSLLCQPIQCVVYTATAEPVLSCWQEMYDFCTKPSRQMCTHLELLKVFLGKALYSLLTMINSCIALLWFSRIYHTIWLLLYNML